MWRQSGSWTATGRIPTTRVPKYGSYICATQRTFTSPGPWPLSERIVFAILILTPPPSGEASAVATTHSCRDTAAVTPECVCVCVNVSSEDEWCACWLLLLSPKILLHDRSFHFSFLLFTYLSTYHLSPIEARWLVHTFTYPQNFVT